MNDGAIREHARALRETRDGAAADPAATRQRILAAAYGRARRRRAVLSVCVFVATVLLLSSAWAAVSGKLPRVLALVGLGPAVMHHRGPDARQSDGAPAGAEETTAGVPVAASAGTVAAQVSPEVTAPATAPQPAGDIESTPAQRSQRPRAAPVPFTDAAADAEESLYEAAHREHFVVRDPGAALGAWDAYLAAYPDGRFALEARYNRALTLVRLSRKQEARAALVPFAEGRYGGGYRRAEARELLDALAGQ